MITVRGGLKRALSWVTRKFGFELVSHSGDGLPEDFDEGHRRVIGAVRAHTMTSPERLFGLIEGVRYVIRHDLPGAFVECGVYKGGSMMAVALTLMELGVTDRDLYLYDTFEGMPEPTAEDVDLHGTPASEHFERLGGDWLACSEERVKEALLATGYPPERVHFVPGKVEDTIPGTVPDQVALLRLDTDWYASTLHEMRELWPLLATGGVLIVDDYGHFAGARQAVDEYLEQAGERVLLGRLDYTGRMCVKG
ncbi:macrocin O-methyltransferase [Candidatus Woesearchaeota archaeon]|jgi:hypothetical protein|nr:macrocin O-methyltransferase [Candidatus Woesearchaeota archaeon]MDP6740193.1 TylF/MycF/NovP-related O-methyltransferase [Planctomycetota bacterium]MDP6937777.1 TylF/MycF/NovP-related O-methyltransferase [Planctomycetota bacterium]